MKTSIDLKVRSSKGKDGSLYTASEATVIDNDKATYEQAVEVTGRLNELISTYHSYKINDKSYNVDIKRLLEVKK